MPQQIRTRRHTVLNYSADQTVQEDLKRGMIIRELMFRFSGTIDVGADGGQASAGEFGFPDTFGGADAWQVIQRIEIVANGSDVLRSMSGEQLFWMNYFQYGKWPRLDFQFFTAAADANIAFEYNLVMPFWMPAAIRPLDTALDTRTLGDLRIEITWRGSDSFINGGVGTGFVGTPTLEVYALESFGVQGPFAQTRIHQIQRDTVAVQNQFEVTLPTTSIYRSLLINTKGVVAGNAIERPDLPNALNNVILRSGTTVFQDLEAKLLQDWGNQRTGRQEILHGATADDVANIDPTPNVPGVSFVAVANNTADRDAWYYLDLVTDGRLTEGIDTLGFSELILELDVGTAVDLLTVIPLQVIPVRAPSAAGRGGRGRVAAGRRIATVAG